MRWLVLFALACEAEPETWPAWPRSEEAARSLIAEHADRSTPRRALDASEVIDAIDRAAEERTLIAGWRPIAAAMRSRRIVVAGMHHDALGQHAAFRRLFGATGTADRRTLALELFDARGRWGGVTEDGDQSALDAYATTGDGLDELRARLGRGAYTAWKYDLIDEILALVIEARAASQEVRGCDLPRTVRFDEALALRMRELHCALSLRDAPRPIAILIGDAHTAPEGLPSFLDGEIVLRLIGGRRSDAGIEPALAERLSIADPLLVPWRGELLLVIPDERLAAQSDLSRVRERGDPGVSIEADGAVVIDGRTVGARERLSPGAHTFVASNGERRLAGALPVREGDAIELIVSVTERSVTRAWTSERIELPE